MKSIFDASTRDELVTRMSSLSDQHNAQWGKMNVSQMLKHCALCDDMFLGHLKIKRVFIGRIFGPMVLKRVLKDDKPFRRNSPTSSLLKTTGASCSITQQKGEWLARVNQYKSYNSAAFVHPFFGPMTREQVGLLAYKHADHHLRQFGV